MRKLDQLTGWRFIAAFGVVLCHFSDLLIGHRSEILVRIMVGMANFVGFFFILSGFILAYNYQSRFISGSTTVREFLTARFARIYPAVVFSLLVALPSFLFITLRSHTTPLQITGYAVASLLLIKTWLPFVKWNAMADWNGPMWSIETEFFFYLCFPFLVCPLSKLNLKQNFTAWITLAVAMIGLSFGYDVWLSRNGVEAFRGAYDLFHSSPYFCILEFVIGIVTYNISIQLAPGQLDWIKGSMKSAFPMIVLSYVGINAFLTQMSVVHGLPAILFSLVILGTYTEPSILKALGTTTFVFLGEISYSLYLLHIPVRRIFEFGCLKIKPLASLQQMAPPLFALLIILTSLGLASFCFRSIETPWRKKLRSAFASTSKK